MAMILKTASNSQMIMITEKVEFIIKAYLLIKIKKPDQRKIQEGVRKMKGSKSDLPVIIVGGAAFLLGEEYRPEYYNIANAYGTALADISATVVLW